MKFSSVAVCIMETGMCRIPHTKSMCEERLAPSSLIMQQRVLVTEYSITW